LIWVSINASRSLASWFSSGTIASQMTDISEGSFYDRNAYLLLMVIGTVILARRRIEWGQVLYNCRWLILLFAYYLFSTLWSVDIFVAVKRWIKADGDIIMILILLTEADPVEALRAVFIRAFYVLVPLSVLVIKYYPDIGRYLHQWTWETSYCGITTGKNQLGQLAMLGGLFLLWQMVDVYRQRGHRLTWRTIWPDLLVLGMCLWLLHLARSSTALLCFLVGTMIFFCARLSWVKANLKNLGWCVVGMALLMLLFTVSPGFRGVIAGALGRDATLTDRTLIWDMALKSGSNPIIGEGYESYWLSGKGANVVEEFHVDYAHNGYLDQYLDTGWIGVLLFVGMLYAAGRNTTSHFAGGSPLGYLFMCLFWSCLLFNYTEIAFGRSNVFGFLILLMVVYGPFVQPVREADTSEEQNPAEGPTSRAFAG
jgi:exopolysaccharide production protein ExoQ